MPEQSQSKVIPMRNIREAGKRLGSALHKEAENRDLSGNARQNFVLAGLNGAIIGLEHASNPDNELIDYLHVMVDMLSDVAVTNTRRVKPKEEPATNVA